MRFNERNTQREDGRPSQKVRMGTSVWNKNTNGRVEVDAVRIASTNLLKKLNTLQSGSDISQAEAQTHGG
jgi:hypothetical protein